MGRVLIGVFLMEVLLLSAPLHARAAEDGRRAVEVKRFGISVRVPQAWSLVDWARNARAFKLQLPQDEKIKLAEDAFVGRVACDLGVAPESLKEFQTRLPAAEEFKSDSPGHKLVEDRLESLDAKKFGKELAELLGQRLIRVWQFDNDSDQHWYVIRTRVIHDGTLYTFDLSTDEAHYDSYRLDFEEMLTSAKFSPPETGLRRMASGYWMQRDYRFALRLPADWKPALGPSDQALFFATGSTHKSITDSLLVLASPPQPLDMKQLKETLPGEIRKVDPTAQVASCQIVPQGGGVALETVVHTKRDQQEVTILERHFRSSQRNYLVRFTCEAAEFTKLADELRKSLDSFVEVLEEPKRDAA
jgi:hypothetical protein